MEEWRSGRYTKKEMMERYRMLERTFRNTIKKYADAEELDDYKDKPRAPNNPHRKFTDEEYKDVVETFDSTREEQNGRFENFVEDMRAAGRNLSPAKLNAQKNQIWDVRLGVRKIKAIVEKLWESAEKTKSIGKSYVHKILKKSGKYPEKEEKKKPKEFDNHEVKDFFVKKGISWIKISKPWNNPFAERGTRTIKHEYVNQVWIWNFSEFKKLSEVIKPHYNECRPHQSFDNKTPAEVRIAVTGDKRETSEKIEKWDTFFRTILGRLGTAIS